MTLWNLLPHSLAGITGRPDPRNPPACRNQIHVSLPTLRTQRVSRTKVYEVASGFDYKEMCSPSQPFNSLCPRLQECDAGRFLSDSLVSCRHQMSQHATSRVQLANHGATQRAGHTCAPLISEMRAPGAPAIIRHKLSGFRQRKLFSHCSGGFKSTNKVPSRSLHALQSLQGRVLPPPPALGGSGIPWLWPCPPVSASLLT